MGNQDQCLSAPQSGNWTTVEVDNANDLTTGGLVLITFCNINCEGAGSSEQNNTSCFLAAPNCFIGSFSVTQTASGVGNSSSTRPSHTPKSKISTGTVIGGVIGGVVVIGGLIFIPFFLLRRARKRQQVSPFDISELSTPFIPSPAATTIDERRPTFLTANRGQATRKFIRANHSSRTPIVSSYRSQIHHQEGSGVRFSETEGAMVQLPPLYSTS
ncbi:hypothetical protein GALMADRAFT_906804 [Galerina marginata CBS 339.88]|uniref:Uncharacterized protein n=1 Tax=Galerina marginata (strain CBS 339.88) TaxID=685588 RepID=A0A067SFQ0_GALM3|nr:hypothetical protein GALMADRAFT_906804 [Galerina marginata CBS 339.88]